MEKMQKFFRHIILLAGVLIFAFLSFYSCFYTKYQGLTEEALYTQRDNFAIKLLILAGLFFLGFLTDRLAKYVGDCALWIAAILVSILIPAVSVMIAAQGGLFPYGDQECVYTAAVELYTGEYRKLWDDWYYVAYPFQLGLAQIYAFVFRLTGGYSVFRIQCFQAVLTGISILLGFYLSEMVSDDTGKRRVKFWYLLLVVCFFPQYLYTNFLYGETWVITCSLAAMTFFILANKEGTKKYRTVVFWFLTGIFLMGVMLARIALVIVGIAMLIIQVLICLRSRKIYPLVMMIVCFAAGLAAYKGVQSISEKEIGRAFGKGMQPALHVAMGLQDDDWYQMGPGSNNGYNIRVLMECDFDTDMASEIAMENIRETLEGWRKDPKQIWFFFKEKQLYQWTEPSYGSFYFTRKMNDPPTWIEELYFGKTHDRIYYFLDQYQSVFYIAMLIYFITLFADEKEVMAYLIGLAVIGGFLYTMIWESKSRYVYPYIVIALPCAAMGMAALQNYLDRLHNFRRNIVKNK